MTETFSQSVIEFFGEHGDELPDEVWQIFHRWYHRVEMAKCDAEVSATNEKSRRQRRQKIFFGNTKRLVNPLLRFYNSDV